MDPFTQRILERAEQRSKALGLTVKAKGPLTENNQDPSSVSSCKQSTAPRKPSSSTKRTVTATNVLSENDIQIVASPRKLVQPTIRESKENVDLAVEINITSGPNVQVQVELEEQDIDADGNVIKPIEQFENMEQIAMIRDSSRDRLQRLSAMYSDTENLSSPIHRNEARFDDNLQNSILDVKPTKRIGKLTALANTINSWEDDLNPTDNNRRINSVKKVNHERSPTRRAYADNNRERHTPSPVKEAGLSVSPLKQQPANYAAEPVNKNPRKSETIEKKQNVTKKNDTKQLKWDKTVMDALEMQGFQRRTSIVPKLVYDFNKTNPEGSETDSKIISELPVKNKVATVESKVKNISKGLVSNRTAMFENAQKDIPFNGKPQKDPTELPLKERVALFERRKGEAPIPKAALGMAPSMKQIMGNDGKKDDKLGHSQTTGPDKSKIQAYNKQEFAESNASGNCIRSTVAALMSSASTISESQISEDIRKQREKELNVLLNRFNKPPSANEIYTKTSCSERNDLSVKPTSTISKPPPAPPMPANLLVQNPTHINAQCFIKRKSNESLPGSSSNQCSSSNDDPKRIKVENSPTKSRRLYPILSDIESTTADSDQDNCTTATCSTSNDAVKHQYYNQHRDNHNYSYDEDDDSFMEEADSMENMCNVSLGREIMQAVRRNDPMNTSTRHGVHNTSNIDSTTTSEASGHEMDDYLDEALDEEENDEFDENPTRKGSISSNSFSYEKNSAQQIRHKTIKEDDRETTAKRLDYNSPIISELKVNPSDDNNIVTLTHTVSFYRRQQTQGVSNSPVRKVTYADHRGSTTDDNSKNSLDEESTEESEDNDRAAVQEKVKRLFDEVDKQHQIMKQTSQALNLCAATFEFSGSTESVEGERHLLIASHRREAAKEEIEKLQQQRCIRPPNAPTDRGRLIIKEITLPLKPGYKEKMDSATICGHHLVCLVKYNETVLATKTVPTLPGLLAVKFPDVLQINNVYADFKVTLEIHGMIAQPEVLPHDIKYHINKKGGNKTPKGKKGSESRLIMPPVESAGGPHVVRTPALSRYGVIELTLREIQRHSWTLSKVTGVSPLEGLAYMKVNCELSVSIDHKGFLTMFEDVAGFGAWHRRWCRLHGHLLSFWRYPDDEKKKPPMGSIDLRLCCTQKISVTPRDVCARLHTFLVELKRPSQEDDKDSLVINRQGKYAIVRHLLSADTKQEREIWCAHFNKALVVIRSWQPSH